MRLFLQVLFASVTMISTIFAQQDTVRHVQYYYNQGTQSYQSGDYEGFKNSFLEAIKLRPANPAINYNLACGYALTGESDKALDLLEKLAEKGIDFGVDQDRDFESIKSNKRFKHIISILDRYRKTINNSKVAYILDERDLLPEGIAYDPVSKRIFLSSIYKRKIIQIDESGIFSDFTSEKQDNLYSTLGMEVDSKRRHLWVCNSGEINMKDFKSEDSGQATIHKYDLSGKLLKIYRSTKNEFHEFNDLTINPSGDVYITDSQTGQIFFIHHVRDSLELLFDEGLFIGSNGISLTPDGRILFVAAYSEGVYKVNLDNLNYQLINSSKDGTLYGIDGLYFYKNSLIAVQNGIQPDRIARYFLSDDLSSVTKCEIIEMNNDFFDEPTTGVIAGDTFYYIANSQLRAFDQDGNIFPNNQLKDVTILKTEL